MKTLSKLIFCCLTATAAIFVLSSFDAPATVDGSKADKKPNQLNVGVVNFKKCVEASKIGKLEQANFETLKKQMESVLSEKEKTLNEMAAKFNDPDYLDSLSPEAETELKRKFRAQSQDLAQLQNQYMQALQQTNIKVIQKLNEMVAKATETIAKNEKFDLVLNEEAAFFYGPTLDVSDRVIAILDADFEKLPKEAKEPSKSASVLEELR